MSIWIKVALTRMFSPALSGVTTPFAADVAHGYAATISARPRKRHLFRNRASFLICNGSG